MSIIDLCNLFWWTTYFMANKHDAKVLRSVNWNWFCVSNGQQWSTEPESIDGHCTSCTESMRFMCVALMMYMREFLLLKIARDYAFKMIMTCGNSIEIRMNTISTSFIRRDYITRLYIERWLGTILRENIKQQYLRSV